MEAGPTTLLLDARAVTELLDPASCIEAVERAFRGQEEAGRGPAAVCGVHAGAGVFHVKAAQLSGDRAYFAAKANANFPGNPERGLPTIQGLLLLFDAGRGEVLAVMDSAAITTRRTAAATAVAAKYLARPDARVLTVCGCGVQGRAHVEALAQVLPLMLVYAYDRDGGAAARFAAELSAGVRVEAVDELSQYARASDVVVTCTPSRTALLGAADVGPGAFVAGVGADSEEKQELAPDLLARGKLVVDVFTQCALMGDLRHALAAGVLDPAAPVYAELSDVVAGRKPGRESAEEVIIFDSTGTAIQDVAAAALVYERAIAAGRGATFAFR